MSAPRMDAAVVGCGFQGLLHLEALADIEGVRIAAVCDRNPERLEAAGERFGVEHRYLRHEDLLAEHSPHLLTICTMPDSHPQIALDAFETGAAVLCEKPMAADLDGALAIARAAQRTGSFFTVGFNLRHSSAARAIKRFADAGELGVPVCARGSMLETEIPWWGPHHDRSLSGGGAIASTAVHMIDLLMWLAGNPQPLTATASVARLFPRKRGSTAPDPERAERYDAEDLAFGHVRFDSGFWLSIEGSWTWDEPGSECRLALVGDRAQASAEPLRFWMERDGELVDVTGAASGDLDFPSSVRREIEDVVERVRSGRSPEMRLEEAVDVQGVVDALYRSASLGREVTVTDLRSALAAEADQEPNHALTGKEAEG